MPRRSCVQKPTPTWTCPHCQCNITAAELRRLDNDTLQCPHCKLPFPAPKPNRPQTTS
ncbi:hypothetical protein [Candidatus Korobacter versatilis]|uniref:hypothetical protein n=1 Tax=Candidatus Korobacter versatilis TaxID=658062 RepID=UPI001E4095DD|nr:hypothetical protein [Candidatus Koribacter versatilis]